MNEGEHDEIIFATGTDEHGYKIQKKAKLENQDCAKFCDNISCNYKKMLKKFILFKLLSS
jgi:methionyl-tRNA synthetase